MNRKAAALLAGLLLTVTFGGGAALAHARYDHSTPGQGAVVQTAPARVDIYTAQAMRKTTGTNEITVAGPDGSKADDGTTVVDDNDRKHYSVGLKPNLPPGRHLVSFKTLSDEDGEADQGQFAFYVGTGPTDAQKAGDAKLATTAKTEEMGDSHSGLYVAIGLVVAAVLIAAAAFFLIRARRRSAP